MSDQRSALLFHKGSELYGSDRMFIESVRAVADAGIRCAVVTPDSGLLTDCLTAVAPRAQRLTMPTLFVLSRHEVKRFPLRSLARLTASIFRQYRFLRRSDADVVLINTVTLPATVIAARLAGRPTVVHVHEDAGHLTGVGRSLAFSQLRLGTVTVAASRSVRKAIKTGVFSRALEPKVVNNAVQGQRVCSPLDRERPSRLRVLYLGRISEVKGVDIFLKALKIVSNKHLPCEVRIVGGSFDGNVRYLEEIDREVDLLKNELEIDRKSFTHDPWQHYEWCHVVVVPSRSEPFGLVALEAQLAGRLAVVSGVGGLREIVEHGVTGLVFDAECPASLAEQLLTTYSGWQRSREISRAGERSALLEFSPTRYRAEVLQALSTAAGWPTPHQTAKPDDGKPTR